MAKRRKASVGTRRAYFSARRARRSSRSAGIGSGIPAIAGAALYGAGRAKLAEWVTPVTSKLPFGGISDNVGMLGVAWAAKKWLGGKVPMLRQVADAAMLIEAAQIGQELAVGGFGTMSSAGSGGYPV